MEYTIPFVVGKKKWPGKPTVEEIRDKCQTVGHYVLKDASIAKVYQWITEGRCWRAGTWKDGASSLKKENFIGAYLFALDFDSSDKTPQEMIDTCRAIGIEPNFWYWSFSQGKKPGHNFRLVWVFDSIITPAQYENLYRAVLEDSTFAGADKATKDISRLWFGTNKGGELLNENPVSLGVFALFKPKETAKSKRAAAAKTYEQGATQHDFIMPDDRFPWELYLKDVCDLWDKWMRSETKADYLHYSQRLLLFTELKCLKYPPELKRGLLSRIMRYYNPALYAGSKCDEREIDYFLSSKTSDNITNKIVVFNNQEYTISEYFNSGAYLFKSQSQEGQRITPEELTARADEAIPDMLSSKGIQYIECQTGAGKTERIINYLNTIDFQKEKIIYSVPRYKLINEFLDRLEKSGFDMGFIHYPKQIDYTGEDLLLMDAGFPEGVATTDEMLERKRELQKLSDDSVKGLFLITHSCLTHLRSFNVDKVIIDENIEDTIVNSESIPIDKLYALRAYVDAAGKAALDTLIAFVENGKPQEEIQPSDIDINTIFSSMDYKQLVKSDTFHDDNGNMYAIGKLRFADRIATGENRFGEKYLYFRNISKVLDISIRFDIGVKLFTGTPKLEQLKLSLPQEIANRIDFCVIERAKPHGTIYQYRKFTGSKHSLEGPKTWNEIIKILEENGVDWQHTNTLVLKKFVGKAKDLGFHVPQDIKGEDIYIENCAGLDCLKAQNLIVIGKADKPKEAYFDMVGDSTIERGSSTRARSFEDIPGYYKVHGFNDNTLWELQAKQMRQMVEQAVDRARTLWNDVQVYVFCDLPVRDAIMM